MRAGRRLDVELPLLAARPFRGLAPPGRLHRRQPLAENPIRARQGRFGRGLRDPREKDLKGGRLRLKLGFPDPAGLAGGLAGALGRAKPGSRARRAWKLLDRPIPGARPSDAADGDGVQRSRPNAERSRSAGRRGRSYFRLDARKLGPPFQNPPPPMGVDLVGSGRPDRLGGERFGRLLERRADRKAGGLALRGRGRARRAGAGEKRDENPAPHVLNRPRPSLLAQWGSIFTR